ncbi:MAG: hypothetical protein KDC26_11395 [Armatimonadetes bacterium]|nr:hypothetical protein [Armatimonadota bacterium]
MWAVSSGMGENEAVVRKAIPWGRIALIAIALIAFAGAIAYPWLKFKLEKRQEKEIRIQRVAYVSYQGMGNMDNLFRSIGFERIEAVYKWGYHITYENHLSLGGYMFLSPNKSSEQPNESEAVRQSFRTEFFFDPSETESETPRAFSVAFYDVDLLNASDIMSPELIGVANHCMTNGSSSQIGDYQITCTGTATKAKITVHGDWPPKHSSFNNTPPSDFAKNFYTNIQDDIAYFFNATLFDDLLIKTVKAPEQYKRHHPFRETGFGYIAFVMPSNHENMFVMEVQLDSRNDRLNITTRGTFEQHTTSTDWIQAKPDWEETLSNIPHLTVSGEFPANMQNGNWWTVDWTGKELSEWVKKRKEAIHEEANRQLEIEEQERIRSSRVPPVVYQTP